MTMPEILRRKLMERIDIASEPDDGEVLEEIDGLILGEEETRYLPVAQKAELRRQLFYSVRRLDVLQELLEDAGITEIMVNGYQHIFVERNGRIERYGKSFTSAEKLEDVIQQIVGRCNRVVNEQNPIVDARLENGDRVNVVMKPVALNGPILTIRRFPEQAVTMEFLVSIGSITKEAAEFLQALVRTRYSMMIGGATGSGKTTFLTALSAYIPKGERIITIEDNAELQIQGVENLVRLEAKEANLESGTEITIRDLIRAALRMRPNRVIIGEVRGAETFELLSALNTGHAGSLSTAHANSVKDMISRLETMVLMSGLELPVRAIRDQISSALDLIVHQARIQDGSRKITYITEVQKIGNRNSRAFRTRRGWKPSGGGDRRDHRDGGGRNQNGFFVSKRIWERPAKDRRTGTQRKTGGENRMRIRAGSQAKTGMAEEKETKGIDYQTWEFTGREYLEIAGISLGIAAAVNLLCYRAWWACIAVVPVGIVCFHTYRKNRIQRRKEELYDSFRDLIAWMHTALRSGYSMENAVLEAAGQLEQSLGKENILVQELRRMRHKMMISVPVEQLFQDLAVRSRIDDIATFASVLVIAKRTGGNVCEIFQNTWDIFCTRIDTMREIRAGVSSRRFEQNIMSVVPFGILGYVQLSFPEFLSVMYGNVIGVFFMSGCLAVYLAAWVLGKKILDIEF